MPQKLEGSCHCGAVKFTIESSSPVPFEICYCSVCRKVAGGEGGTIYIGGIESTLKVEGEEHIRKYRAVLNRGTKDEKLANGERSFCSKCSSGLWWDKHVPGEFYPFASAIDTPLKSPPKEMVCCFMDSKPDWVRLPEGPKTLFEKYPDGPGSGSLEDWHRYNGEWIE
ncbi:DUF636 domain-containing protein [Peniophora sp. CONT]|nr:DUF636 domain-containing protein [Peniophora sp. CONT]